jgi:hypothetical protein
MAESVRVLPKEIRELVEVYEWDLRTLEGVRRFRELGARSLPSIALDGEVVFASIIPGQEELIREIRGRFSPEGGGPPERPGQDPF